MTSAADTKAGASPEGRAASPRSLLAELASAAAEVVPGVDGLAVEGLGTAAEQLASTLPGGTRVPGVVVLPDGPDRYGVSLAIRAELVDLVSLADDVRRAVRIAAAAAGLEERLGAVSVRIVDVVDRKEAA